MEMIAAKDLKFDELTIGWVEIRDFDVVRLNDLYDRGHFKRLKVIYFKHSLVDIMNELRDINGRIEHRY